mgnify:CR=1 FL=1
MTPTLFVDNNNNGCQDAADSDTGLANETVEIWQCDAAGNPVTMVGNTTTGTDGSYTFGPDEPGSAEGCLDPAETYKVIFTSTPANHEFSTNDT